MPDFLCCHLYFLHEQGNKKKKHEVMNKMITADHVVLCFLSFTLSSSLTAESTPLPSLSLTV